MTHIKYSIYTCNTFSRKATNVLLTQNTSASTAIAAAASLSSCCLAEPGGVWHSKGKALATLGGRGCTSSRGSEVFLKKEFYLKWIWNLMWSTEGLIQLKLVRCSAAFLSPKGFLGRGDEHIWTVVVGAGYDVRPKPHLNDDSIPLPSVLISGLCRVVCDAVVLVIVFLSFRFLSASEGQKGSLHEKADQ